MSRNCSRPSKLRSRPSGAAPLVSAPHRWFELQEAEDLSCRDPLAEQSNFYAGHRAFSIRQDREEEPVLDAFKPAAFADSAVSIVRLGSCSPPRRGSLASGEPGSKNPGRNRSPLLGIRHMMVKKPA